MNEIFNFKRFGRFFVYDLRNNFNNYSLSLLICGAMPLVCFAICQLISRIFTGDWIYHGLPIQICSVCLASCIVILTYPVKVYGSITDKRKGSSWVMIPASATEKTLSIIISSCVVLPIVFFCLLAGFDALLGLAFPECWPKLLFLGISDFSREVNENCKDFLQINLPGILCVSWVTSILNFILGSIFFKKAKIGKTFLVLFVLGQAMSVLLTPFFFGGITITDIYTRNADALEDPLYSLNMLETFNWFFPLYVWGYFILVVGLIWTRIRTIKH